MRIRERETDRLMMLTLTRKPDPILMKMATVTAMMTTRIMSILKSVRALTSRSKNPSHHYKLHLPSAVLPLTTRLRLPMKVLWMLLT